MSARQKKKPLSKAAKLRIKKEAHLERFSQFDGDGEYVYGVDPGGSGGICGRSHSHTFVVSMPTVGEANNKFVDGFVLQALFTRYPPKKIVIEQVGSMPRDGHVGAFRFGNMYGAVVCIALAQKCEVKLVSPAKWKRAMGLIGTDKKASMALACKKYPALADKFKRVTKDDGVAEAALIADYEFSRSH
jgi:Holliday junction resolvasome RuvABC endonuclease subunit